MNVFDAICISLKRSQQVVAMLLGELTDTDLLVRPVPEANHSAWQLGHLIASEQRLLSKYLPGTAMPALPPGFVELHGKEGASKDSGFCTKSQYLDLFNKTREATIAAVGKLTESDLDKPTGWEFAPTVGSLLLLNAEHVFMHVGQFSVVRRKLGKPVLF